MAVNNAPAGGDFFSFDIPANEGALIAFRVREYLSERFLTPQSTKPVHPVLVDLVVLTGSQAKTVRRGEEVVGAGITGPLRKTPIGDDMVGHMAWGKFGSTDYVQANPATAEELATAIGIFESTGGDPYSACETATKLAQQAAPAPTQAAPPAAAMPAAPPANTAAPVDPAYAAWQAQQAAAAAAAQAPAAPPVDPAYAAWQAQQAAAQAPAAPVAEAPPWQGAPVPAQAAAPAAPQPVASGW